MDQLRIYYEMRRGKRVADSHWWKIRKTLKDADLELSQENLDHYLELRKYCPRYTANLKLISDRLKDFILHLSTKTPTGGYISTYLERNGITPTQATLSRWFKAVGGYRKDRIYKLQEVTPILMAGLIYQIKKETSSNG